ncbi:UNVERIFIED_CONTAM: Collagen alpha-1(IX) chain [Trichonephila clavipes]
MDCEKQSSMAIDLRGPIDVNGDIMIAKYQDDSDTVPLELQWMVMSCDPTRPERETCDELPVRRFKY